MDTYSCRLLVLNQQRVKCEIRNPQNAVDFEYTDSFDYGPRQDEISRLSSKARENDIQVAEINQLGNQLFNALFNGDILNEFLKVRTESRAQSDLLRIELEFDETNLPQIASLPWEFMRAGHLNGRGNFWLATDPNLALVRRRPRIDAMVGLKVAPDEKMRVATVIANSVNKTVPYKDFWADIRKIEQSESNIQLLELVDYGTKKNIDYVLAAKPHILHLVAHGDLKIQGKETTGFVYIVDVTGDALALSGPEFAEMFARYSPPIVILHVCESGAQSESDALSGIASQIVDQNVPAVIAMQYPISNAKAREFMSRFYFCLSRNEPIEKALQEGRREITLGAAGYTSRDFATPILYLSSLYKGLEKMDDNMVTEIPDVHIGKLRISVDFQNQFIEALLECESMADPVTRQQIFARLPNDIRYNIGLPNSGARVQLSNVVRLCTGYSGGIENLLESVEFFERNSSSMQKVKHLVGLD